MVDSGVYMYLVMEYCSGGDLFIFIRKKQALPEKIVRRLLQQLGKVAEVKIRQALGPIAIKIW